MVVVDDISKGTLQINLEESRMKLVFSADKFLEKAKVQLIFLYLGLSKFRLFKVVMDGNFIKRTKNVILHCNMLNTRKRTFRIQS